MIFASLWHNAYRDQYVIHFTPYYVDLESVIGKIDGCKNNPEKSSTTKVSEHIPSDFSMPTISLIKDIENKHYVYRGKDHM